MTTETGDGQVIQLHREVGHNKTEGIQRDRATATVKSGQLLASSHHVLPTIVSIRARFGPTRDSERESGCSTSSLLRRDEFMESPVYAWCLFVPAREISVDSLPGAVGTEPRDARTRHERDYERTCGWDSSALLRISSSILTFVSG